jgi:hypothetical protein
VFSKFFHYTNFDSIFYTLSNQKSSLLTENGIYLTDTEALKKYGPGGHTITARHTIDAILGLNNHITDSGGN